MYCDDYKRLAGVDSLRLPVDSHFFTRFLKRC